MAVCEKAPAPAVTQSDIQYIERRLESAYEDRRKIKKMIRVVVAVLVDKKMVGENLAKTFSESKKEVITPLEWYEAKLWIKKAIKRKGALRAQLGIKEGETIPKGILQRIIKAETGTKINFRGKSITVTTQLKRRALLAVRLGKMPKRRK